VFVIGFFVFLLAYYGVQRPKSFTVSAFTEHLRVETVSLGAFDWTLTDYQLCIPLKEGEQATQTDFNPKCASELFHFHGIGRETTVRWTDDYVLEFRSFDPDFLYIYISRHGQEQSVTIDGNVVTDGSILFIPRSHERLVLPILGRITLGEIPYRSDAMILLSGDYEIRQQLFPRLTSRVVSSGSFFKGDKVSIAGLWSGDIDARVFLTSAASEGTGFDIVATTSPHYGDLLLTRVGGQPTRLVVGFADRLKADPLPAAFATLLGLLATSIALVNNFFGASAGRAKKKSN